MSETFKHSGTVEGFVHLNRRDVGFVAVLTAFGRVDAVSGQAQGEFELRAGKYRPWCMDRGTIEGDGTLLYICNISISCQRETAEWSEGAQQERTILWASNC